MFFNKLFVLVFVYFLCVIPQTFSMMAEKRALSSTKSMPESEIHTLGQLIQIPSNHFCITPDGKLKVELIKTYEQKNEQKEQKEDTIKKGFRISIILAARNKTLESMDFEEESTPKLFVSSTNHVVLQRGQKYNIKELIKKPKMMDAQKR